MTRSLVLALLVAGSVQTMAVAQTRRFQLNDLGREVGLGNPRLSPDGRTVALITSRVNYPENRFERTVVLVDVGNGTVREITPGRRNISGLEWSPSGDRLAFTDRDGERTQLFVMPLGGGEARRITDMRRGVTGFAWRPDGRALGFLTEDDPIDRPGEERHNKSFEVGPSSFLDQTASLPSHFWTVSSEGGPPTRITSGERSVTGITWTPDGASVLLSVRPRPHSGELINATIVHRELATGTERLLTDRRGFGGGPALSPDGRTAAVLSGRGPELGFRSKGVFLVPVAGGTAVDATPTIDRDIGSARWLPDGRNLLLTGPDLTRISAWLLPVGGTARKLDWGAIDPGEATVDRAGAVVFVGREPNRPPELYHLASIDAAPRRLTEINKELAGLELGRVETIAWSGPDGFAENGVLVYPPGYTAGRKYPLVLSIHGGPMGTSIEGWSAENQLYAAQGWIVFSPNYRGSNNMGDKFQRAVVNDAGDGPGRDVMAGIAALKSRGIVDESRMAPTGWSYGGYMTAWLTAQYSGWRAAVAGAAVTDWFDWYNLADMNTWAGFGLGGSPWRNDNAMNYWRQSPMAYAHKIKAPTLILSTTGDPRVTVTQSYKLYHALRDNGTEVQFIAYPTGGHFPPDPIHQRDVRRRWIEWLAKHFAAPATD